MTANPRGAAAHWRSSRSSASTGPGRRLLVGPAAAAAPSTASSPASPVSDAVAASEERGRRLESMIQLRKLYRNLLRAEVLLQHPSPVYEVPAEPSTVKKVAGSSSTTSSSSSSTAAPAAAPAAAAAASSSSSSSEEEGDEPDASAVTAAEAEALRRLADAVEVVGEMELTAEQLKAGLRSLKACPYDFPALFKKEEQKGVAAELEARVATLYAELAQRADQEIAVLPFPTEAAAHAAIDARNARYRLSIPWNPAAAGEAGGEEEGGAQGGAAVALGERLSKAEKAAEYFVARRLQPAVLRVKQTSPEGVVQGLKSSAVWAKGLWTRLNGSPGQPLADAPAGLPLPVSSTEEYRKQEVQQLERKLDGLEKKLQDASKARENRLRKAGLQGRARMASELRDMDNDIAALSKALAVRTLQLEMEYAYGSLEDEARDIVGDSKGSDLKLALSRRGSSDEVALLVAEFSMLDEQLAGMAAAVEAEEALFIDDSELARLATDIPDLRVRLGIGDTEVFGGQGFSLVKVQLQIREGVVKVVDGVLFGVRGVKLLLSDCGSAGKLFWRAVRGGTLKPREVQALRRTIKDLLAFIPFTIILIVPLTPIGHVLIFGFIQKYFPGLFPSQFTGRRQDLMAKYDELKRQLRELEVQAEAENDEQEYRKKEASAMAALGRTAVASLGAAPAAAAATAAAVAATALGGELEVAMGLGAAAAAAGAAAAKAVAGSGSASGQLASTEEAEEEEEGPAAKALRQIEEQLEAAESSVYTGEEQSSSPPPPTPESRGKAKGKAGEQGRNGILD